MFCLYETVIQVSTMYQVTRIRDTNGLFTELKILLLKMLFILLLISFVPFANRFQVKPIN